MWRLLNHEQEVLDEYHERQVRFGLVLPPNQGLHIGIQDTNKYLVVIHDRVTLYRNDGAYMMTTVWSMEL